MKVFYPVTKNVGDILAPIVFEHFTNKAAERADTHENGKVFLMGSVLEYVCEGDIILGVGSNKPDLIFSAPKDTRFYSVRGPLTRNNIKDAEIPEIYGDFALLMPFIYKPEVEKVNEIGYIPHYVDKDNKDLGQFVIDIEDDWKTIIDKICSCKLIISSSLHGIVLAEAYGIPVIWAVYSDKIAGGEFKFQDYFLGTGREIQKAFKTLPPIVDLDKIQDLLKNTFNYI